MKRIEIAILLVILSLGGATRAACAQDTNAPQQPNQAPQGRGAGQHGGRGAWGGGGMMGRGVMGTVTEIASDHFTVKTESGDLYTIHYSANTRIMKGGGGQRRGQSDSDLPSTPPQQIKATEIKVGDAIAASGEIDANAKSVGAVVIFQIDPERAKQMREMQANYGKTWLMGRVTAVNETNVTLQGGPDSATHKFVADENTTFRKRREPITLADIQVGDMVRVEGALKNGSFLATTVAVMGPPPQRAGQESGNSPAPPQ
jgi:preprotein translocase subunit YajC